MVRPAESAGRHHCRAEPPEPNRPSRTTAEGTTGSFRPAGCLHALPSFLVHWCVLFCIFSDSFVVFIKNLDLDWPLSSWGCGPARQASTPIGVACLTGWVECNSPTVLSMCLRIQVRLCRPRSGQAICPSLMGIIDGALNLVPLCDLDQPMLKGVMAEYRGLVSYTPTSTYFTKRVHIKCWGCPTV